eukprot:Trichotokara_eunicae@DN2607_c0_g1_i1.p1
MLNILANFLLTRKWKFQRLDGTMTNEMRKLAMDNFNSPTSEDFCFLLSTKAGGLGINLTSADTVVIYDSDWNPQNDLQAEARAHRIGQTKQVQIYRLVVKNSVEESILERAKAKMVLDALVVQGLNKKSSSTVQTKAVAFSPDELAKILQFGAQGLWEGAAASNDQDVDLDTVLDDAEKKRHDDASFADDLLSSFTNVSDFRYVVVAEKKEEPVENFWSKTMPQNVRKKKKKKKKKKYSALI